MMIDSLALIINNRSNGPMIVTLVCKYKIFIFFNKLYCFLTANMHVHT